MTTKILALAINQKEKTNVWSMHGPRRAAKNDKHFAVSKNLPAHLIEPILSSAFLALPLLFLIPTEGARSGRRWSRRWSTRVVYGYLGIFSVVGLEAFESTPRPPKAVFPRRVETRL